MGMGHISKVCVDYV